MSTELRVPDPIHTKMELLLPQPLETKSSSELAITQPIVTEVNADLTMDVKPVVVDLCLTLSVGKLPRTCVRRQYDRHMGLTFFGVELVGFNRSGESQFTLDELLPRSHFELGGTVRIRPSRPRAGTRQALLPGPPAYAAPTGAGWRSGSTAEMPASKRPAREAGGGITLADDQPVVVNGDPRRLSGTLRLRNDGEEAARIGQVVVRDPDGNLGLSCRERPPGLAAGARPGR